MNKSKLMYVTIAVVGIAVVLFGLGSLIVSAIAGGPEALLAIGIAFGIVAVIVAWSIRHVKRRQQPAIDLVKQQEPVVYFCAFPLGQELFIASSNKTDDSFKVWGIKKKRPVLLAQEKLSTLMIQKSEVQLAPLRKSQGIAVQAANDPAHITNLALYNNVVKAIMPPLKDQALDEAVHRLKQGV